MHGLGNCLCTYFKKHLLISAFKFSCFLKKEGLCGKRMAGKKVNLFLRTFLIAYLHAKVVYCSNSKYGSYTVYVYIHIYFYLYIYTSHLSCEYSSAHLVPPNQSSCFHFVTYFLSSIISILLDVLKLCLYHSTISTCIYFIISCYAT